MGLLRERKSMPQFLQHVKGFSSLRGEAAKSSTHGTNICIESKIRGPEIFV